MRQLAASLKAALADFRAKDAGSVAVETIVILPILFWTYLSLFSIFYSYRTYSINQKAAYTIGDMISRETAAIDQDYLDGALQLMGFLTNAHPDDLSIVVTTVRYDADLDLYLPEWSQSTGFEIPATDLAVKGWAPRLPNLLDNEIVVVVQTFHDYDPPFKTGLERRRVENFVFTSPRYAPQFIWDESA